MHNRLELLELVYYASGIGIEKGKERLFVFND